MSEPVRGWSSPGGTPDPTPGWSTPTGTPPTATPPTATPPTATPHTATPHPPPTSAGVAPASAPAAGWAPSWSASPGSAPGVVPLRPLGVGELLDGSIKIMRRNPRAAYGISAAVSAVVTVVTVLITLAFVTVPDTSGDTATSFGDGFNQGAASNAASIPDYVLRLLAGLVLSGVLVTVVSRAVLGQATTLDEVRDAVRPRIWSLLGLGLVSVLLLTAPLVITVVAAVLTGGIGALLLLPAIPAFLYLWVRLSLAPSVLLLERATIRTALRRSGVLLSGSFWRCFGVLVLGFLIASVLASILSVPVALGIAIIGKGHLGVGALVAAQVMAGLAQVIVAPFSAGVKALLYIDQRMRLEGLDVALQSAAATRGTAGMTAAR